MRTTLVALPLPGILAARPAHLVRTWMDRAATRRALARLDERLLADIGVSARASEDEASKPFWQD